MRLIALIPILIFISKTASAADESIEQIRVAAQKAIPWLEKGIVESSGQKQCFTCHNHALPVLALAAAKRRQLHVNPEPLKLCVDHTLAHLQRGQSQYLVNKGQGGAVLTAGYALWALDAGGVERNETTDAVVHYLVSQLGDNTHWIKRGRRPPSDGSDFTATYVALRSLKVFHSIAQTDHAKKCFETVSPWLIESQPVDTEDGVFRLKALQLLDQPREQATSAVEWLLSRQMADGGWAQATDMKSDAYATGTVLATLIQDGGLCVDRQECQRAKDYLLQAQHSDGTWHVATRAEGFQPYYESGFPYGEDQFISISATSWAVLALLQFLPELQPTDSK